MPPIQLETAVKYASHEWGGYVLEEWQSLFPGIDDWLASPGQLVLDSPCRRIARHDTPKGIVYSKLMWAQNDGAVKKKEIFAWLKWTLGPQRALQIWIVSRKMLQCGHLCAEPVLAVRKYFAAANLRHLNLLVTKEVTSPTLEKIVLSGGKAAEDAVVVAGECLALLHADRFLHGDYLPRNACLQNGKIVFLDNDKTSHWNIIPPFFLRQRNLDQFAYNLTILAGLDDFCETLPLMFIDAYCHVAGLASASLSKKVMLKAKLRWQNKAARIRQKTQ